jgi:hypothetical protein
MAFAVAQQIFASTDDPVFALPPDPTQRPFLQLPTSGTASQWSRTQGDYSWFAVIDNVQKPWNPGVVISTGAQGGWGDLASDDNGDGVLDNASEAGWPTAAIDPDIALWQQSGSELWHVSVVVVYKRNLQLIPTSADEIPPERMCLGGGDCVIYVPVGMAPSQEWLNVKPNQWIMLSGFPNLAKQLTDPPVHSQLCSVQWFRLSAVGEIQAVTDASGNVTAWQRAVTLSGPDLNPYKFMDAVGAPGGNQSLYATIVDGVTGVFEATIEQGQ